MIEDLTNSDPILRIIRQRLYSPKNVYIFALILNLFLHGIALYNSFLIESENIVPIWESGQIIQSIAVGLIASPLVWVFSLWIPILISDMVVSLVSKGLIAPMVILQTYKNQKRKSTLLELIKVRVNQRQWSVISFFTAVIGTLIFFKFIVYGQVIAYENRISVFYYTPTLQLIYSVYFFPHIYLIALTIFRTLAAIQAIAKFFSQSDAIAKIALFHPDHCGGFGNVGKFSQSLGLFVVMIGFVTTTTTLHPVIMGGQANIAAIVTVSLFYIILVPILVLVPIWTVHIAMKTYRDNLIQKISEKADFIIKDIVNKKNRDSKRAESLLNQWNEVEKRYNFLLHNIPVWPLSWLSVRRFSITATIPILINLLTIGLSFLGT